MKVTLVSVSKPVLSKLQTTEDLIVYTARVSNPNNQLNLDTGPKLLKYCLNNKHFSIFEMGNMCVEIQTSRGIAPQILRHKSFSFQEFSLRYANAQEFELYQGRSQDKKNRQNSLDNLSVEDQSWFIQAQQIINDMSKNMYEEAIKRGIAKECARNLLPMSTKTKMYMSGSIRSWIHYLQVRTGPETQLEHREIANSIKEIFIEQFPIISEALDWKKD